MPSLYGPSAFYDVLAKVARILQHTTKIDLIELAVDHTLQKMGAELKLPIPPGRPFAQNLSSPKGNNILRREIFLESIIEDRLTQTLPESSAPMAMPPRNRSLSYWTPLPGPQ